MPTLDKPVSFIATTNPVECRHFYENILNLTCLHEDDYALVFSLGSSSLRIQKVDTIPTVNYTVLGWEVDDIRVCAAELICKGISFEQFAQLSQDSQGVWNSPSGASIAWFKDPDGNTLSLTQL